jgi:hypothetical protein
MIATTLPPIPGAMRGIEPGDHKHKRLRLWAPDFASRIRGWV